MKGNGFIHHCPFYLLLKQNIDILTQNLAEGGPSVFLPIFQFFTK
jgi:hypothetical protein